MSLWVNTVPQKCFYSCASLSLFISLSLDSDGGFCLLFNLFFSAQGLAYPGHILLNEGMKACLILCLAINIHDARGPRGLAQRFWQGSKGEGVMLICRLINNQANKCAKLVF